MMLDNEIFTHRAKLEDAYRRVVYCNPTAYAIVKHYQRMGEDFDEVRILKMQVVALTLLLDEANERNLKNLMEATRPSYPVSMD